MFGRGAAGGEGTSETAQTRGPLQEVTPHQTGGAATNVDLEESSTVVRAGA